MTPKRNNPGPQRVKYSIDRIVHHGRILRFHGESYRNKHSLMK